MAASAGAGAAPAFESKTISRGVVVNPAARVVYVMDAKLGVVAVDIATGKQRWAQRAAVMPLVARGAALVAADATGALVVLDAKTGAPSKKGPAVPRATGGIRDGLGS